MCRVKLLRVHQLYNSETCLQQSVAPFLQLHTLCTHTITEACGWRAPHEGGLRSQFDQSLIINAD